MTQVVFLPHEILCPEGAVIDVEPGTNLLEAALEEGISVEHACEMACACTTCHLIIREGFRSLETADELEEDLLDKAWGLTPESRLGCQVIVQNTDLVVEIPRYTINQVSERR